MTALLETLTTIANAWLKRIHERKETKRRDKAMLREFKVEADAIKHDTAGELYNDNLRNKIKGTDYIDLTPQGLKAIQNEGKSDKAGRWERP
jgi:hypothetical protein